MNEIERVEQTIKQLAEVCRDPSDFINLMENLLSPPSNEKGDFFLQIGLILEKFSYFCLALHSYHYALKYYSEHGNELGKSWCYGNLGIVYGNLGNYREAVEFQKKSLKIAEEIGNKMEILKSHGNLGIAYGNLGNYREAVECQKKSLKIAEEIGDEMEKSKCYIDLGIVCSKSGKFRKAIRFYKKSLQIIKEIGDIDVKSKCYTNLGIAYGNLGKFRKAIEYYEKSLKIAEEIGNRSGESKCISNLGTVYRNLGDFYEAEKQYKKSLKIAKEIGDKAGISSNNGNLGTVYSNLGDHEKAIEYYNKALQIAEEIGDKTGISKCYEGLGIDYSKLGNHEKAIEYYTKALMIIKEIGDEADESSCYGNLATSYGNLGNYRKAVEYYEKALNTVKITGNIDWERSFNLNLGRIYYASNPELAYDYFKRSIELSERITEDLVEEKHKINFYAHAHDAYQYMIPLCLNLGKKTEAFEYTEGAKSRAFLNLIAATDLRPTGELTSELHSLLKDEKIYLTRLREIQTRHLRSDKISLKVGEIERIRENLVQIYDKIEKFDPEYVFIRRGKPLPFNKICDILSSQKRDTVLVEYFINEDKIFVFVVSSKDHVLHVKTVLLPVEKLNQYVWNYWREVVEYSRFGDIGETWLDLSQFLIESISDYISEGDLIYFIPHSVLHYLPLHALKLNNEPLIRRHPVVYVPSASILKFCQGKGSNNLESCASFGVVFKEEAEDVAELFGSKACCGSSVSKDEIAKMCTNKDIIHFSCHGFFNNIDSLSSGIILHDKTVPTAKDILTAREIFDMRLNTEMVTLSACQTGLNETSPGDELIGLTRAFLYAGAPSVVVSLWSVYARSTHDLMLEFYRQLKKGVDKATALQRAQIEIMEKEEYGHPYYWAPFILVGDWQ